ncbi:8-amino-7-oxononanoate synthase 2 [Virgibacillus dokdonensis]|uniref:8-amino-7-oxononanoate synthase n=1 Tax=Virgibacillus dokdonensis TaxID=302167 RepID=A0A2K9IZD0_9BACI|nr:8-amino-7-oxononanoate synthase [Virgibacillus dokdonensis]AUJ24143.1 8-amino-7-oxononanoate synthase 2 [Virgibacillus dokdonensis]
MLSFDDKLHNRVKEMQENSLYRTLRTMETASQSARIVDGEKKIIFSSNDYLGLANDKRLIHATIEALQQFGVGSSGSRLTTGNTYWHEKLEKKIATFKQTEAARLFSSGYLANIGVLSALAEAEDVILSDQYNHASIIDGCRLSKAKTCIYRHVDMEDLERKLAATTKYKQRFIVTDGVFSMDGSIAPLDRMMELADHYHAYVIVDDAHATGVLGQSGRGTSAYFGIMPDVVIGTCSKAIGTEGGFVAGSSILVDFLKNHARTFIFQTALPPAICVATYTAIELIEQDASRRERLHYNIRKVKEGLNDMGYAVKGDHTAIIPVIIGDQQLALEFAKELEEKGIYAPAIRPPTVPNGESRIRLTVTASHSMKDMDDVLHAFYIIGKKWGVLR